MTRDEAKRLFDKCKSDFIVDKIYDYFENRKCDNRINDYQCDIQDRLEIEDYYLNFDCTFFREKEAK